MRSSGPLADTDPLFRNMADHAPVMMWVTDPSGYCVYLNRRWYEFTGQSEGEAEGFGWLDATHPDDRERAERAFLDANAAQAPFRVEYRLRRADSGYRWAIDAALPRFGEDGAYLGYVGSVIDIDERREQEERVRASEQRFRAAVDAVQGVLWTNDASGRMMGEQPGWARLTGQSRAEYEGFGWAAAVHPDDAQATVDAWNAAVAERRPFVFEHRVRRADGSWGRYAIRAIPTLDPGGEILEWVGVHTDITAQREAEEGLQESEARLRALFDAVPVGVVFADAPSGRITGGNAQVEEVFGHPVLPSPDVDSYRDWISHHADGRRVAGQEYPLSRAIAGEAERPELEVLYRRGDGRDAWVRLIAAPVRDEAGAITGGVVACLDVDREKRAEVALREERDRARGYLQVAGVLLLVLDEHGRIQVINRRGAEILGHSDADTLIGQDWFDLAIPPSRQAETRAVFAQLMAGEIAAVETYENPVRRADGSERLIAWRNTILRDDAGRIVGTLSSGDDVTEQRLAREREHLMAQEIDHRAKNLLAVVQSVVQLTRAEDIRAFKEAVSGRIQSLARTHGLLAAARWEGADLKQLVCEELAPYSRGDAARTEVDGPAVRLTPPAAQTMALVVHELATNSAKYGALSVASGRLAVAWSKQGEEGAELLLTWAETGGPAVAPPSRRGFGSVVLQSSIERQLRGRVELDWRTEGLACRLTLPFESIAATTKATGSKPVVRRVESDRGRDVRPMRVLVVEDEALIAAQIEAVLTDAGHEVLGPASRLSDAFDQFYELKPDAALLDINVAGERSFPFAELLLAKGVPFAFCSGYGETSLIPEPLRSTPVISKPADPVDLIRTVGAMGA